MWKMSHHLRLKRSPNWVTFVTSPWSLVSFLSTTRSPPFIDSKICIVAVVMSPNIKVGQCPVGVSGSLGSGGVGTVSGPHHCLCRFFHDHNFTLILVILHLYMLENIVYFFWEERVQGKC